MRRLHWMALVALLAVGARQEAKVSAASLAARCGSEIEWITDLDSARQKARESGRLILWYVGKVVQSSGFQGPMYKAHVLDKYMQQGPFMDEDFVQLIRRKFIPFTTPLADALSKHKDLAKELRLTRFNFFEPGFVFMTADGKIVHKLDRIRTFDADFLIHVFRSVLLKNPEYNKNEDAQTQATGAALYRRERKWAQALESIRKAQAMAKDEKDKGDFLVEEALILQKSGKLADAEKLYARVVKDHAASSRHTEAQVRLGAIMYLSARETEAKKLWQDTIDKHPESRWSWKAAAELTSPGPSGHGPLVHAFEPLVTPDQEVFQELSTHTGRKRTLQQAEDMIRDAVEFLLTHQNSDGIWVDSQYDFAGKQHMPNTWMAITAVASMALLEWADLEPARIRKALERAEAAMLDPSRITNTWEERSYAHAYRLSYFARRIKTVSDTEKKKYIEAMNSIARALEKDQDSNGFWKHEYTNPFVTATALISMHEAREAGATVTAGVISNGVEALRKSRGKNGTFPYEKGIGGPLKSSGRTPHCELALYVHAASTRENLEKAVEAFFDNKSYLDRSRYYDYHADEYGNAGFFYYYSLNSAMDVIVRLKDDLKSKYSVAMLNDMLNQQEIDGTFVDDHEVGKTYGTGMALLIFGNVRTLLPAALRRPK